MTSPPQTASSFHYVRRHQRSIGQSCLHCGRSATTTAVRKTGRMRMPVHYCEVHDKLIIQMGLTRPPDPER